MTLITLLMNPLTFYSRNVIYLSFTSSTPSIDEYNTRNTTAPFHSIFNWKSHSKI